MRMLRIKRVSMVAGCLGWLVAVAGADAATPLTTKVVATGLVRPIWVTHAPDDFDRIFIIEKQGIIKVLHINTTGATPTVFMNIDARVSGGTSDFSEQGLLGLAFDPDFNSNGYFYVNYTNAGTRVSRFSVDANDPDLGDDTSEVILLTFAQPESNHNGGWLGFGPNDGMLYISTGDGGGAGDMHGTIGNGQSITTLLGKMLRIDVNGDDFPADPNRNYAIPPDNPFVNTNGNDEIWAYGLRNPWRDAFDSLTADLWIADVGQSSWEEVDVQTADSTGGENYGWRCREGMHNYNFQAYCSTLSFVEPIAEYSHALGCSISGGDVYRGCRIPDLRGEYFYADFCSGRIWSLRYDFDSGVATVTDRTAELNPTLSIGDITSLGRDAAGELYICDQGGQIYEIFPGGTPDAPTPFDWDNDGDVDDFDAKGFVECATSPLGSYTDCQCDVFDDDTNGAIDLADFMEFQIAFTG